jgi:vacuolar-type H+-ATPase subunit I/STV1
MGSWWRSEEMTYVSVILSEDAAAACVRELGVLGCMQFADLNPELTPFQRRYVSFIKRCDEIERKIRYLNGEVKKMGVPIQPAGTVDMFVESIGQQEQTSSAYLLESLESKLGGFESQLLELNKYSNKLAEEYAHKVSRAAWLSISKSAHPRSCCFSAYRLNTIICCASLANFLAKQSLSNVLNLRFEACPTVRWACK